MTFRWSQGPSTGKAEVYAGMGDLANNAMRLAVTIKEIKTENELSAFAANTRSIDNDLADALKRELDSNKYADMVAKSDASKEKLLAGMTPAAQRYGRRSLDMQKAVSENFMLSSRLLREKDTFKADIISDISDGNYAVIGPKVEVGLENGWISKVEAERYIEAAQAKRENDIYIASMEQALSTPANAQAVLDSEYITEDGKQRLAALPNLDDIGQILAIKNLATSRVREGEQEKLNRVSQHRESMAADAQNFKIDPVTQFVKIQGLGLTDTEEIALFKEFTTAREMIVDGFGSPYDKTMNPARLTQMQDAANVGKLTESQISAAEGKSDGISRAAAKDLRSRIAKGGTAQNFRDSSMAKTFLSSLKQDTLLKDDIYAEKQGLRWLEAWSIQYPDASQREADEQALSVYERVEREGAAGTLPFTAAGLRDLRLKAEARTNRDVKQGIWEQLTPEERIVAMQALKQGKTEKEIIAYFEAHK